MKNALSGFAPIESGDGFLEDLDSLGQRAQGGVEDSLDQREQDLEVSLEQKAERFLERSLSKRALRFLELTAVFGLISRDAVLALSGSWNTRARAILTMLVEQGFLRRFYGKGTMQSIYALTESGVSVLLDEGDLERSQMSFYAEGGTVKQFHHFVMQSNFRANLEAVGVLEEWQTTRDLGRWLVEERVRFEPDGLCRLRIDGREERFFIEAERKHYNKKQKEEIFMRAVRYNEYNLSRRWEYRGWETGFRVLWVVESESRVNVLCRNLRQATAQGNQLLHVVTCEERYSLQHGKLDLIRGEIFQTAWSAKRFSLLGTSQG